MNRDKLLQLLHILKGGTESQSLSWKYLPDEEMIRTDLFPGAIRLGKTALPAGNSYTLWLIDSVGDVVAEWNIRPESSELYEAIQQVYDTGLMDAKGGVKLLDLILSHHKQLAEPIKY